MKKFLVLLLSIVCIISTTAGLTACDNYSDNGSSNNIVGAIDLANCEIGYELPVYPTCEFDYKVNDNMTVHIKNIKVRLVEKNIINEDDEIAGNFYPYVVEVTAEGSTAIEFANTVITLQLRDSFPVSFVYSGDAVINSNGTINWSFQITDSALYKQVFFYKIKV